MGTGDRILGYVPAGGLSSERRRWPWWMITLTALVAVLLGTAMMVGWMRYQLNSGTNSAQLAYWAAQIPTLRAAYLNAEGHANRGPKFEELAMTLQLTGSPLTEAQMVQTLGPPDLMQRNAAGLGAFAYFYDGNGKKDQVIYFDYQSGTLQIGSNVASVNAQYHAQMVPYAPLPTTRPTTSAAAAG